MYALASASKYWADVLGWVFIDVMAPGVSPVVELDIAMQAGEA